MSHEITCQTYKAKDEAKSRRCRYFTDDKKCSLADGKLCGEWLKANKRDLLGHPIPKVEKKTEKRKRSVEARQRIEPNARKVDTTSSCDDVPVFRNLTDEQIESFKKLNVEVCLESEALGTFFIVPEYSDSGRREISVEHAATLAVLCGAFEGTKVTRFEKIEDLRSV